MTATIDNQQSSSVRKEWCRSRISKFVIGIIRNVVARSCRSWINRWMVGDRSSRCLSLLTRWMFLVVIILGTCTDDGSEWTIDGDRERRWKTYLYWSRMSSAWAETDDRPMDYRFSLDILGLRYRSLVYEILGRRDNLRAGRSLVFLFIGRDRKHRGQTSSKRKEKNNDEPNWYSGGICP